MQVIQQWHKNAKEARKRVTKSKNTPHGLLRHDFGDYVVTSVTRAKDNKETIGGKKLYNIHVRKKKKRGSKKKR